MYKAEISRNNPACFLFLIDQSGSMSAPSGGGSSEISMSQGVADAINRLLSNLVIKCSKDDGVRNYFEIGVIGYGGDNASPAFLGKFSGQELVKIEDLANNPSRIEVRSQRIPDGAGGILEQNVKFPIWFEPVSNGGTPMCKAITYAKRIIERWVSSHMNSYPPIVINITDGASTDGNPISIVRDLSGLNTNDGNVLFLNCHLSSHKGVPILFPDAVAGLPDEYAVLLFEMSSILPDAMIQAAQQSGFQVANQSRGFVFNADLVDLIRFIDIGTRPANLR